MFKAFVWSIIDRYSRGEEVTKEASMAKLKSGRLLRFLTDACLQFWGGRGYMEGEYIERAFRDARMWSIGGGTDEVMLMIIAKKMALL